MTGGVSFGKPENPFNEARDIPEFILASEPIRGTASKIIRYMSASSEVATETIDSKLAVRGVHIDCTAPFATELKMYLNGTSALLGVPTGHVEKTPAKLSLGDLIAEGKVIQRWVKLSRPDGSNFGVSGVSRRLSDGTFESWQAITMLMEAQGGKAEAELWGETADADGTATTHFLREGDDEDRYFEGHFISMLKAMGRLLARQA